MVGLHGLFVDVAEDLSVPSDERQEGALDLQSWVDAIQSVHVGAVGEARIVLEDGVHVDLRRRVSPVVHVLGVHVPQISGVAGGGVQKIPVRLIVYIGIAIRPKSSGMRDESIVNPPKMLTLDGTCGVLKQLAKPHRLGYISRRARVERVLARAKNQQLRNLGLSASLRLDSLLESFYTGVRRPVHCPV